MIERWAHQISAFDRTIDAIRDDCTAICVTSPTGTGKTRIMLEWAAELRKRAVLYTNRRLLREHTPNVLEAAGVSHGIRASGMPTKTHAAHAARSDRQVSVCVSCSV